jgi:hypothetical protein
MKNNIGIGVIDVYTQADLDLCLDSLPETDNLIVVSDTKNKSKAPNTKKYGTGVQFATLRNWIISQFRLKGEIEHIFILTSNQIVGDKDIFKKTIKVAETFGTLMLTGNDIVKKTIEDDEKNQTLTLSSKLNPDFLYINNKVIDENGYFDDIFFNTKDLDVIDYVKRLKLKNMYTPQGYHPIITGNVKVTNSKIQKPNYVENDYTDKTLQMSYAYFIHKHKIMPNDDISIAENDELLKTLEDLQKTYGK